MNLKIPKKLMKRLLKETPDEFWKEIPAMKRVMFHLFTLVDKAYLEGYLTGYEEGEAYGNLSARLERLPHPAGYKSL